NARDKWADWRRIGGFFPPGAPVCAVARTVNHLDLFVFGTRRCFYLRVWTSWGHASSIGASWRPIGGFFPPGAPVSAVARTGNNLDLFVVGNDGRVYTSWWYAGADWSGVADDWRPIGGLFPPGAPVSAVSRTGSHLATFAFGN